MSKILGKDDKEILSHPVGKYLDFDSIYSCLINLKLGKIYNILNFLINFNFAFFGKMAHYAYFSTFICIQIKLNRIQKAPETQHSCGFPELARLFPLAPHELALNKFDYEIWLRLFVLLS
jgi:hypothetical protein